MPAKKGIYYVSKDVGKPRGHYLLMEFKGKRPHGKLVMSKLKKYKAR